jgi:hypothetical protein
VAATMFVPEQTVYLNNLRSVACSRRWENYTEVIRQFREPWRNHRSVIVHGNGCAVVL